MNKINIVIPMAGLGSRFQKAGYETPKPFIDVNGIPMIERVIKNVKTINCNIILVAQNEHLLKYKELCENLVSKYNVHFVGINGITPGTAVTVLAARKHINTDTPLLIANSDQIIDFDINKFIEYSNTNFSDGCILCFKDPERNTKWSFVKLNDNGQVIEAKEKEPISEIATVGIYYFSSGSEFIDSTLEMIISNDKFNNEFYTCPVYNYYIRKNPKVGAFTIEFSQMHGIGTPEDLTNYLKRHD